MRVNVSRSSVVFRSQHMSRFDFKVEHGLEHYQYEIEGAFDVGDAVCRTRMNMNPVESSLPRLIIPFAVPLLTKSASLTLFIKASCSTSPSASSLTS
jgi:hypothetical protein